MSNTCKTFKLLRVLTNFKEKAEAEVVPSSSLVEVKVEVWVEAEVEVGVEFEVEGGVEVGSLRGNLNLSLVVVSTFTGGRKI